MCVTKFIDTKKQIINTRDYNPSKELYLTGAKTISMNEQCHTNWLLMVLMNFSCGIIR